MAEQGQERLTVYGLPCGELGPGRHDFVLASDAADRKRALVEALDGLLKWLDGLGSAKAVGGAPEVAKAREALAHVHAGDAA